LTFTTLISNDQILFLPVVVLIGLIIADEFSDVLNLVEQNGGGTAQARAAPASWRSAGSNQQFGALAEHSQCHRRGEIGRVRRRDVLGVKCG
jgi:hypothetical protein